MRTVLITGALVGLLAPLHATTLQQLSLDDMIRQSSEIVRGTVQCTGFGLRGSTLYTNYRVKVSEQWKGTSVLQLDFAVPGGFSNGIRQTYAGAPSLRDGQEFVLFLWTSRSGLRQLIGLSQGLFNLTQLSSGQLLASRSISTEQMVDANGKPIDDTGFAMPVTDLRSRVASTLTGISK
ncbi:MAG: hypothetical protein ACR2NN_12005 [Bryobacteraceae bacterium]